MYEMQPYNGPPTMPGQPYAVRFTGYDRTGVDAQSFLLSRFNQTHQLHQPRLTVTERMLNLWASVEHELYGTTPRADNEERLRTSKPWKIVDLISSLVWNKDPQITVAPSLGSLGASMNSVVLEKAISVLFGQYNLWDAFQGAAWWCTVAGVGPVQYFFDPFAMADESPLIVLPLDPRTCIWKESVRGDGTVDYAFSCKEEFAYDIFRKWNVESLGSGQLDAAAVNDPTYKIKVYDYWADERVIDPETGTPRRMVVNAVFTEHGRWLRPPEIMVGYSKVPFYIFKGTNYPIGHSDPQLSNASVLYAIADEIKAEAHLASYVLMNAKDHVRPSYNITSNDGTVLSRISAKRGSLNRLKEGERLEPMNKGTGMTQDVQYMLNGLSGNIEASTLPRSFEGGMELKDISGISLSMAATGPLIRIAKRQQFFENGLQQMIPAMMTCLGRHAFTARRPIRVSGPDPADTAKFFEVVIDPREIAQTDMRVNVNLSSSLPRDQINEVTVTQGLVREGILSKYTGLRHILKIMDLGVTDPADEARRIAEEQQAEQALQMQVQMQAPPQLGGSPPENPPMLHGATQGDMGNPQGDGPLGGSPFRDRQPTGVSRAVADTALRGQGPTSDPTQLRRRSRDLPTRLGGTPFPMQPKAPR
jgi:hypothetical protein